MRSGEEIRAALARFARRWKGYADGERPEAQTFLNELFACYGTDRRAIGARFEDAYSSTGIMDLHLPGVVIIEMKAPREAGRLARHREQALAYWANCADVATGRPAPQYVVLCAFHRFEIWEPGRYPRQPRLTLTLDELSDRYEALMFLAGSEPLFRPAIRKMTEEAAAAVAGIYRDMLDRRPGSRGAVQRFMAGVIWRLFADRDFATYLGQARQGGKPSWLPWTFVDEPVDADLGLDVDDGGPVAPTMDELRRLAEVAEYDWRAVDPTIFGSLLEGLLSAEARGALGAYYTHEVDILRIVRPTVVRPWQERISAVSAVGEAAALLGQLFRFRVLDPACGCGNFLYVAYRELCDLVHSLKQRLDDLAAAAGSPARTGCLPYLPLSNMYGFDREPMAVRLARLTLRIGYWQMRDRYGSTERSARAVPLPNIRAEDALTVPWPEVDCVIGNPPFLGSQQLRRAFGARYLNELRERFGIGVKDYCVYWFRRTHDHLKPGQRAGLVGTNSITQNRARPASLEYIVANGGVITDAVSSQDWPGSAAVDVSLVNWVKSPDPAPTVYILDGARVAGITAELRTPDASTAAARPLPANRGRCFQGMSPVGEGFVINADEAHALLARADARYRDVVRPYLTGEDIAESPAQQPRRWVIDFGHRPLEVAMRYPAALEIVRERVRPVRESNNDRLRRAHWWRFGRPYTSLRSALEHLPRYLAAGRVGKRLLFAWCERWTCPSDLVYVFAFTDDYSMGVLSSFLHETWVRSRSSTLEDRLRYTPTSAFLPFPWPYPVSGGQRALVAEAARQVLARRQQICAAERVGLTKLYNLVDDGAYPDLKKLHRELDDAVAACYSWPRSVAQDAAEITRRLLRLNQQIAAGERPYHPFGPDPAPSAVEQLGLDYLAASRAA